jgi:glucose/arabinose dehydrogenase
MKLYTSIALLAVWLQAASAQDVACNLTPDYPAPVMADGWESRLIMTGLSRPRSILFDSEGGLLVVQQRAGITHLQLADGNGTCLSVAKRTELVRDSQVSYML